MSETKAGSDGDEEREEPAPDKWRALVWLGGLTRPYRGRLALVMLAMLASSSVLLLMPHLAGTVVDTALLDKSLGQLKRVILGMFGLFAVAGVLDYLEGLTLRATSARLMLALRGRLHGHLLDQSPAFFERERVGELLSRLTADIGTIGQTLSSGLVSSAQQIVLLIGTIVVLFAKEPRLTAAMLLAVPPVVLAAVFFGFRFQRLSKERQKRAADANVAAEEAFAGIRTVAAFGREELERKRYGERLGRVLEIALRAAHVWGAFGALVSFFTFSAVTVILWYGGKLMIEGSLTPGELTSFFLYTGMVASALGGIASFWGELSGAAGATERVRKLLDTIPAIRDTPDAIALARPRGAIAFEDVRFTYPVQDARPAIEGVSLTVEPGEVVALVGPSGGGKSTLITLLLRFHEPQSGRVCLDEHDVKRLRVADLRRAIGLVPQEIFIFGGSVGENIRYGRPDASDAEVESAARSARAWDFIQALPQGLATLVGERGVRLSVGERQRIAIARVFLKDPAVVVLDEATSSLDAESEHLVQQALARLFEGRATLVVAHRLATVRRATRVVLLDAGRIVEQGTHQELLRGEGLYRRFCELQMLDGELPGPAVVA